MSRKMCQMYLCERPAVDYIIFVAEPDSKAWLCAEHYDNWQKSIGEKMVGGVLWTGVGRFRGPDG